ncbi:MAG TPA: hypothetical protein VHV53_02005 [Solirubrobacterales bacterium]|nr:hypothetical protein [Solirubrobacterales bacterium]
MPPLQTSVDITAGNRVFDSLYDSSLPSSQRNCPSWWRQVIQRADSAPDEIEPGLLSETLHEAGVSVRARGGASCTFSSPSQEAAAAASPPKKLSGTPGSNAPGQGLSGTPRQNAPLKRFEVSEAPAAALSSLAENLKGNDLTIVIPRPTGKTGEPIPIGIAGPGFDGNLTSDTTRTNGYVSSTDVAPTIIEFFRAAVPDRRAVVPAQMIGQAIRSEGSVDPTAIESRGARMAVVSHRRGPVIGFSLLAWVLALVLAVVLSRGALAPVGVRLLGLSVVYLPLLLLAGAALKPAEYPEMLLVMLAAPALAALTLAALRDYRALAVAAALTVGAYALDAILGSPLSALSLLGPNPALGVRFYGIGNELEALLAVLIVGGIGAGLAGFAPRLSPGRCAAAFLAIGLVFTAIFASGKFGADVGAAIDFPAGVACAAVAITGGRRRWIVLVVLIPLIVLALLALADLVTGANSHFTRSVLDAGGLHSLGDTAQRRLEQTAHSFVRPILAVVLPAVVILAVVAWLRRATLAGWVRDVPAMRAALIGAAVATIVATLVNDSGALLLEIAAAYLLVFVGWAWAEGGRSPRVA